VDISEVALQAQVAWFRGLAAGGFPQISADDGFAVSTGLDSNTENGAVIAAAVLDNPHDLAALLVWLRDKAVPASVLVTGPLEPEATARLIDRGLEPERTGNNMGRLLAGFDSDAAGLSAPGWQISEVTDVQALRQSYRVYADDGWWDEPSELDHRVEIAARLGFGPGRPVRHWTACYQVSRSEQPPRSSSTTQCCCSIAASRHAAAATGSEPRSPGSDSQPPPARAPSKPSSFLHRTATTSITA
jgi:hypothetical protein